MSILAVYERADLRCPQRVLTHLEDIRRTLDELGVSLSCADAGAPPDTVSRTHHAHGMPAYQQVEEQLTEANVFCCGAITRTVLAGQLRLCVGASDWALVIALREGDRIALPANLEQAILPAAGVECRWQDAAADEAALVYHPLTSPVLVGLLPLDI
ncbi:MAG: hypothetical protein VW877_08045 [Pseudomonadaceae bacterium]